MFVQEVFVCVFETFHFILAVNKSTFDFSIMIQKKHNFCAVLRCTFVFACENNGSVIVFLLHAMRIYSDARSSSCLPRKIAST